MTVLDSFKNILQEVQEGKTEWKSMRKLAQTAKVNPSSISSFLTGARPGITLAAASNLLEVLGYKITPKEQNRDVFFVDAQTVEQGEGLEKPHTEDYFAVPLVDEVGAGNGVISQEKILSWVLIWKWQEGIRNGSSNLIAVKIIKGADSMVPTLSPGDIVLVDLNERVINSNNHIWLVFDPIDNSGMIKRVSIQNTTDDTVITYYSDNRDYPPRVFSLTKDFYNDWTNAIGGRVTWAMEDMRNK